MYVERKEIFPYKEIVFRVLAILAVIFFLFWIIPKPKTKEDVKTVTEMSSNMKNALNEFETEINTYYQNNAKPVNPGDVDKITLKDLSLSFKDDNNEACDEIKSYSVLTNLGETYEINLKLICGDNSYIKISNLK